MEGVAVVEAAVVGWRVLTIEWFGEGGGVDPFYLCESSAFRCRIRHHAHGSSPCVSYWRNGEVMGWIIVR